MTAAPRPQPAEGVSPGAFLRAVLPAPREDERIKVLALRPDGPPQELFARTVGEALAFADRHKGAADVYFGVTLKQGPRGDAAHTSRFQALWGDLDGKCFQDGAAQALAALERLSLPPSIVVHSGHGLHAYWLLHEPLTAADGPRARAAMRGLYRGLSEAEGATRPIDDVSDLPRVLRLPGTFNRKSTPPRPVTVVLWRPERRYHLGDFEARGIGTAPAPRDQTVGGGTDTPQWPQGENGHIPEHHRNVTLTRIGGWLRAKGLSPAAIEAALLGINATACTPPLPEAEVRRIARGMARYLPEPRLVLSSPAPVPAATRNGTPVVATTAPGNSLAIVATTAQGEPIPVVATTAQGAGGGAGAAPLPLFRPARALMAGDTGDDGPPWLPLLGTDGLVARGCTTLLSARPKAGKTTLLAHAAREWLALGLRVCWLSEEPAAAWRDRLRRLGLAPTTTAEADDSPTPAPLDGLYLAFPGPGIDTDTWLSALAQLRPDVIIVDTVRAFAALSDENDAAHVHTRLQPWVLAARAQGAALILVHHRNKAGGEEGTDHAGSHAFVGLADIAVSLREMAEAPRRREMACRSRFEGTPPALLVELDAPPPATSAPAAGAAPAYRVLGAPAAVTLRETRERVAAVLTLEWQTTNEVIAQLADPKPSRELVRQALLQLALEGWAEREPGRGRQGDRWRLPRGGRGRGAEAEAGAPAPPVVVATTAQGNPISVVATTAPRGAPTPGAAPVPPAPRDGPAVLALAQQAGYPRFVAGGIRVVAGSEGWAAFVRTASPEALQEAAAWLKGRLGRQHEEEGGDGG
jgi:hypothetical protein